MVADRRAAVTVVRSLASVAMLAILLGRVELSSVVPDWRPATPFWIAAAIAATAAGVCLAAARWQAVLQGMGESVPYLALLKHYGSGLFVGNFLPSTVGGDVVRIRRLGADPAAPGTTAADAFASVAIERLSGWLVLPFITLTALGLNPGLRQLGVASALAAGLAVGTIVLLGGVAYLIGHPGVGGRYSQDTGWRSFAAAAHVGVDRLRSHPGRIVEVLLTGLAYQLCVVLTAWLAARALVQGQIGLTAAAAFVPAVAIAQVIPLSIGGLGIREGAFVLFLHPLGVPNGRAVALGLLLYGMNLLVSLLGAPGFAMGSRRADQPVP